MKKRVLSSRLWNLVLLVACAGLGFAAGPAGVTNFQKLNDSVYRGAQPSEEGFKSLAAMGVKTVLDLREPGSTLRGGSKPG